MITRDPDASFDTPNAVIGSQGGYELTLSFRPDPNLSRLLIRMSSITSFPSQHSKTFE